MNAAQKVILATGVGVIVLMGLMPPWHVTEYRRSSERPPARRHLQAMHVYRPILLPPQTRITGRAAPRFVERLDWRRLRWQWQLTALAVVVLLVIYRPRDSDGNGSGSSYPRPVDPEPTSRKEEVRVPA